MAVKKDKIVYVIRTSEGRRTSNDEQISQKEYNEAKAKLLAAGTPKK